MATEIDALTSGLADQCQRRRRDGRDCRQRDTPAAHWCVSCKSAAALRSLSFRLADSEAALTTERAQREAAEREKQAATSARWRAEDAAKDANALASLKVIETATIRAERDRLTAALADATRERDEARKALEDFDPNEVVHVPPRTVMAYRPVASKLVPAKIRAVDDDSALTPPSQETARDEEPS
jgi:hypothetical protein